MPSRTHNSWPTSAADGSVDNHGNRRRFLADCGIGLGSVALAAMLKGDKIARADADPLAALATGLPQIAPQAKSVIWLFMLGGVSHMESFDPKPTLNKYAGLTIQECPAGNSVLNSPYYRKNVRDFAGTPRDLLPKLYPLQVGFGPRGESGIIVSDWWPEVGSHIDDIAVVRSMWTTDNDHAAELQFNTGRHIFDGFHPSLGAWVHYGLGSLNDNFPQFVVLGQPPGDCCGGTGAHGASYLGPEHAGVRLRVDSQEPLPYGSPGSLVFVEERKRQFELIADLNGLGAGDRPHDAALRARVKSYELAFRMQLAVPELLKLDGETAAIHRLYGLDRAETRPYGQQCLLARRLVERGVRFVQVYHGDGAGIAWDAHTHLKDNHRGNCARVDRPIAGLLSDLKQRGLLDETLVVWGTEFGRTPGAERADGRDHHPYGFSVWMAGGGLKGGIAHGATDEIGFHATEHRHYVTDVHATVLHQLGLDHKRLEIPGHKRLEIDFGTPIREIIA